MKNCAQSDQNCDSSHELTENPARVESVTDQSQSEPAWQLEPHCCRICFARLVSRPLGHDLREYRCSNCEASTQHTDATMGCCCGIKVRKRNGLGRSGGPMVDAGIRCIPNPERTPTFPAAYVASEVVKQKKTR